NHRNLLGYKAFFIDDDFKGAGRGRRESKCSRDVGGGCAQPRATTFLKRNLYAWNSRSAGIGNNPYNCKPVAGGLAQARDAQQRHIQQPDSREREHLYQTNTVTLAHVFPVTYDACTLSLWSNQLSLSECSCACFRHCPARKWRSEAHR